MLKGSLKPLFRSMTLLVATAVSVPLVLGFFNAWHPAFDSFAHFRLHLGVLTVFAAVLLLCAAFRTHAVIALLLGLGATATTLPAGSLTGPVQAALPPQPDQPVYKLLQVNLRYDNPEPEKVLSLIGRVRPDVVTLEEASTMWEAKLALLKDAYPYQINCGTGRYGAAILSRRPFADGEVPQCFDRGSMAVARVDFGGVLVDIAALHLGWPWPFERNWQLGSVEAPLERLDETAIVAGDFNAAPWSNTMARIARVGGLEIVPGIGPTWLAPSLPGRLRFAGLPIDHILSKGGIDIRSAEIIEPVGSDHWPVLVTFSLKPRASEPAETTTVLRYPSETEQPRG